MNTEENFEKIYDQTYNKIFSYIISKCNDISKVEDIIQEVYFNFYNIIMKNKSYIKNYESFLIKLAKNELFKHYNIFNVMKTRIVDFTSINIENIEDKKIDSKLLNSYKVEEIWKAVKKLDLTTQKIMVLYYKEDKNLNFISNSLNLNLSTTKSKLYRGLNKIKSLMEGAKNG